MKIKRRKYELIKMLSQEKEYKPMSYYAQNLNVSNRTISNDLKDLDKTFRKHNLTIKRRPNYGVLVQGKDTDFKSLIMTFENNMDIDCCKEEYGRQAEIIKDIVLDEKIVTYDELSAKLYINSSIIYRDMVSLRRFQNNHSNIISNRSGTRIEGSEYGKQKLLKEFFNNYINKCYHNDSIDKVSTVLSNYYPDSVVLAVKDVLDSLCAILNRTLEGYYLNSLFIFLVTIATRKTRGKELKVDFEILNQEGVELLSNFHLAVEISSKLKEKLKIEFTKNEIDYISYQLFMHRVELSINNKYLESIFSKDIEELITGISTSLGLDLTMDDKLRNALICHMIPMIFRLKSDVSIENPILNEVKTSYPVLFNLTWFHLNDLANKFNIVFSEEEVSFITIHLQVAIERKSSRGCVIVVCETGLLTSELLVSRIRKSLPASIEVKVVPLNKIHQVEMKNVDFIISTVEIKDPKRPYIKVSPFVDDEELREVYDYYLKYSKDEIHGIHQNKKRKMKLILRLMNAEHIYMDNDIKTKEGCLDHLTHQLHESGCVDEKFRDDIYERESLGSTYMSSGVSFPHGMSTYVKESAIAVLLLPKGVLWDDYIVYLVIMFAIKEEDTKEFIEDLPVLYNKVLDYNFINNLVKLNNQKEIKKLILS